MRTLLIIVLAVLLVVPPTLGLVLGHVGTDPPYVYLEGRTIAVHNRWWAALVPAGQRPAAVWVPGYGYVGIDIDVRGGGVQVVEVVP